MRWIFLSVVIGTGASASANTPATGSTAFDRMQALVGEWQADLRGFGTLTSSIRLVSNGKAIEETIGTPTDNETSIYTRDGKRIVLTHFCAMTPEGHVVRLAALADASNPVHLEFILAGTSNLRRLSDPHMSRMTLEFSDANQFSERWTKVESGKQSVYDLRWHRK